MYVWDGRADISTEKTGEKAKRNPERPQTYRERNDTKFDNRGRIKMADWAESNEELYYQRKMGSEKVEEREC